MHGRSSFPQRNSHGPFFTHVLFTHTRTRAQSLVLAVNASVATVGMTEITLVVVEEVLPEVGPAAERLTCPHECRQFFSEGLLLQ